MDDLIDICINDKLINATMANYKADEQTLRDIYEELQTSGAGQMRRGHYVSASSLVYQFTLDFILRHFKSGKFAVRGLNDKEALTFVAITLLNYFGNGQTGEINTSIN